MTPLPVNPIVVVRISIDGIVEDVATNVSPDLKVVFTLDKEWFEAEAANKPFSTTRPVEGVNLTVL